MASIKVKRGSEGPRHDPYSFTEITFHFTNPKRKPVTYHGGLGEWVQHGKRRFEGERSRAQFERLTGLSPERAERIPDILFERYLRTLSPHERWNVLECIEADQAMLRWAR